MYIQPLLVFILLWSAALCVGKECKVQASSGRAWIESGRELHLGEARRLTAIFCTLDPVWFQLWSVSESSWTLVWRKQWQPTNIGIEEHLDLQPDEYFQVLANHRLGLVPANLSATHISVRKLFNSSMVQLVSPTEDGPYAINRSYGVEALRYPGSFVADVCGRNGCPYLYVPGDSSPADTCKTLDSRGKMKLEKHRSLSRGVVKAIRTEFCGADPVSVQIWDAITENKYRLIWEKIISPAVYNGTQTIIPLTPDEYINIASTHRLGLQSSGGTTTLSVAYRFSSDRSGNLLTSDRQNATLCDDVTFEGIPYPMEFILTFCYDTECKQTNSDSSTSVEAPCQNKRDEQNTRTPNAESVGTSTASPTGHQQSPQLLHLITMLFFITIISKL